MSAGAEAFSGFTAHDFDVFCVPGLEPRMAALKERVRPKLSAIGSHMTPVLSNAAGRAMYPHVAKHARRKTNPPNDSWVAFSQDARGYKKWPTFMIGLWYTHLFVQFGVIYEAMQKADFGRAMIRHDAEIRKLLPSDFVLYLDHTRPDGTALSDMSGDDFAAAAARLIDRKQADLLFGMEIPRSVVLLMGADELLSTIVAAGQTLARVYPFVAPTV